MMTLAFELLAQSLSYKPTATRDDISLCHIPLRGSLPLQELVCPITQPIPEYLSIVTWVNGERFVEEELMNVFCEVRGGGTRL